jgi:tRNA threonylcarbamoyladenosine biosynthesis protein TsaE
LQYAIKTDTKLGIIFLAFDVDVGCVQRDRSGQDDFNDLSYGNISFGDAFFDFCRKRRQSNNRLFQAFYQVLRDGDLLCYFLRYSHKCVRIIELGLNFKPEEIYLNYPSANQKSIFARGGNKMEKSKKAIYIANSPAETKKLGFLLAEAVLGGGRWHRALVLTLAGGLGAGKTNFIQGFAKGLGIKGTVNSPTFVILKKYPIEGSVVIKTFYHIDCYRLGSESDLAQLGIVKILADPANIVAIEWPDIVQDVLPEEILKVNFEVVDTGSRRIFFDS